MVSYGAAVIALAVLSPNFAFASKAIRRFENTTELRSAVDQYVDDDACISSADGSGCDVGQTYGWPMNTWDVSEITYMNFLFWEYGSFNGDISDWVVSQVTDMSYMFGFASSFNGDLSKWDISQVTDTYGMFIGASSFNRDLSDWNVSQVTDTSDMFFGATSFNRNLSKWDTSKVTDMDNMFHGTTSCATSFNGDLSEWDISKVTSMRNMFNCATSFNQDLCVWNDKFTPSNASKMFYKSGCTFQDSPDEQEGGPFCSSSCQEVENDGVILSYAKSYISIYLLFLCRVAVF